MESGKSSQMKAVNGKQLRLNVRPFVRLRFLQRDLLPLASNGVVLPWHAEFAEFDRVRVITSVWFQMMRSPIVSIAFGDVTFSFPRIFHWTRHSALRRSVPFLDKGPRKRVMSISYARRHISLVGSTPPPFLETIRERIHSPPTFPQIK